MPIDDALEKIEGEEPKKSSPENKSRDVHEYVTFPFKKAAFALEKLEAMRTFLGEEDVKYAYVHDLRKAYDEFFPCRDFYSAVVLGSKIMKQNLDEWVRQLGGRMGIDEPASENTPRSLRQGIIDATQLEFTNIEESADDLPKIDTSTRNLELKVRNINRILYDIEHTETTTELIMLGRALKQNIEDIGSWFAVPGYWDEPEKYLANLKKLIDFADQRTVIIYSRDLKIIEDPDQPKKSRWKFWRR